MDRRRRTYSPPEAGGDRAKVVLAGGAVAIVLFVVMALAQMMGDVEPPDRSIDEVTMAYQAPDLAEIPDEAPPPKEEEEPPPELEDEPIDLSLEQLDLVLNPGTGGSLAGDFALPAVVASAASLGTDAFVDFSSLDQIPRPIGVSGFNFPRRLLKKKVSGRIVLLVKLDSDGRVLEVEVEESNLPAFDSFVLGEVKRWRFTPPTQQGQPVKAKARLPIPIHIS